MGNNESNPVRNLDKRTARREYRNEFTAAITRYRHEIAIDEDVSRQRHGDNATATTRIDNGSISDHNNIVVCVRKRPFFPREAQDGEFDVVSCKRGLVVVHDARMHSDMKRMMLNNYHFSFDKVFDEKASSETVYDEAVSSLVRKAVEGFYASVLVYGQTGSGKVGA